MKILFVATVDIHIINHHLRIIHKLHEMGHQVDVAANGGYTNTDITNKYNICFSKNPMSLDNFKAQKEIKKIIEEGNYDILSCHTPLSSFFTRLVTKEFSGKVMYMAHGFHFFKGAPLINNTVYKWMEEIAARYTDTLITINREDYEAASKFHLKSGGQVKLIPGVGIDLNEIQSCRKDKNEIRELLGLPQDAFVLLSVGELNKNKNHLFVMQSLTEEFHKNSLLHYVIAGKGPLEDTYKAFIKENHLESQVHLLGYRTDIRSLLYGMDLFLSPSFREGLPVSVLEAMATGVPVLASNVRGNRDLIVSNQNGLLYEVSDSKEFIKDFKLLKENDALRLSFAKQALEDVKQYSIEVIDPLILSLYQ